MANVPKANARPSYMKAVDEQLRARKAEAGATQGPGATQSGDGVDAPSAVGPRLDPLLFGVRAAVTLLTPAEGANTGRLFKAVGAVARLLNVVTNRQASPEHRAAAAGECLKTVRELAARLVDAVTGSMVVDGPAPQAAPPTVPVTPAGVTRRGNLADDLAGAGIDGYQRLAFWDRMGFGLLEGLRYIQMPLEPWKAGHEAEGQVPYLMPLYRPLGSDTSSFGREQVLKMVETYFGSFDAASSLPSGVDSVRETETFRTIADQTAEQVHLRGLTEDPRYGPGIEEARRQRAPAPA